jgi:hypothetical protein
LFKQDSFVSGVLVQQNEAAVGFQDDVEFADDADETERDRE